MVQNDSHHSSLISGGRYPCWNYEQRTCSRLDFWVFHYENNNWISFFSTGIELVQSIKSVVLLRVSFVKLLAQGSDSIMPDQSYFCINPNMLGEKQTNTQTNNHTNTPTNKQTNKQNKTERTPKTDILFLCRFYIKIIDVDVYTYICPKMQAWMNL